MLAEYLEDFLPCKIAIAMFADAKDAIAHDGFRPYIHIAIHPGPEHFLGMVDEGKLYQHAASDIGLSTENRKLPLDIIPVKLQLLVWKIQSELPPRTMLH